MTASFDRADPVVHDCDGAPQRPRYGESRGTILAACDVLLRRMPFDALSLEQVAVTARLSRRTVYNQFSCRDDLFRTSRELHLQHQAKMIGAQVEADGVLDDLPGFALATMRIFSSEPHLDVMLSVIRDGHRQRWLGVAYEQQVIQPLRRKAEPLFFRASTGPGARPIRPVQDAKALITMLQGLGCAESSLMSGEPVSDHRAVVAGLLASFNIVAMPDASDPFDLGRRQFSYHYSIIN